MAAADGAGGQRGLRGAGGLGCLTLATKRRCYVEMAVDLALSLDEHGAPPLTLVVDTALAGAAQAYREVFDHIVPLPEGYGFGRAATYAAAEVTPYDHTLVIDADCLALQPLTPFLDHLTREDFGIMAEWLAPDDERLHHGRPVCAWAREFGLPRYFKASSAVFSFEREAGREILGAAFAAYRRAFRQTRWLGDEIGFALAARDLVARDHPIDIPIFEHPWPLIWAHQLEDLDLDAPPAPLFHAFDSVPPALLDRLMRDVVRRRRERGLPARSEDCWRVKGRSRGRPSALVALQRLWLELRLRLGVD